MMNQLGNTQTIAAASVDPNSVENRYVVDASQSQAYSYLPSATGSGAVSWAAHGVNNRSTENGNLSNSSYHHEQHTEPHVKSLQDGLNATPLTSSSNLGTTNVTQDYSGYTSYPNSSDPYGYGSTAYPGYYSSYQQQPNHSYPQPVGAYENTGAPYQPISSFQNTGSYAGPASYSGTYYNPGDYQTAGGYPSSGYSNQTTSWNDGNYANYTSHQYSNYTSDTSGAYSSGTAPAASLQYQQQYKQWADYYGQTEVSCAPGTENLSVASTTNQVCPVPGVAAGYPTAHSQPAPAYNQSWQQDSSSSHMSSLQPAATINGSHDSYWKHGTPSFQNHQVSPVQSHYPKPLDPKNSYNNFQDQHKVACPQGSSSQYAIGQQMPASYQSPPVQTSPQLDNRRVSKLQIPTNPRIASNLALGLPKTEKDSSMANVAANPAYISVSLPKSNENVVSHADSRLEPGTFPKSLRGYVERALARCKGDAEIAACQAVMEEIIKKAKSDGSLYSRDWDVEPLFPVPITQMVTKDLPSSTPVSALSKNKRSPSRRTKSRWEPLPEEKSIDKLASATNETVKFSGWIHANGKNRKQHIGENVSKEDSLNNIKFLLSEQKSAGKNFQRPVKRQRLAADGFKTADNGDASSDSDKEQSLTSYYSGAIALSHSPEERMKRENRSKRFEKGQGNRSETNRFKPKNAGTGNLYTKRASALVIGKNFEDGGSRAVEDIDWDALTVKGTCQEIEKRYLRLTSAPDPSTVRPEEVLEKALQMVRDSQKNYLYKCDQLKSIRQDLTVQRIRNQLTVKVYETHARLAIENGDLPEYNQCQSQLKILYAEGIEGCRMEFSAYHLLCVILHSNNKRELLSSMSRLSDKAKQDEAVKHALAVRTAVSSGNYIMFFRLYKTAPNLNTCLMDLYVEKMRFKAVSCVSRSYRPTVPVSYVAQVLGFTGGSLTNEGCEEDSDGLEECVEWLKAHGASLVTDNNGEVQLDAKASSSTLFMPEPEDAVAHGDANLAVNDFLARTSTQPS